MTAKALQDPDVICPYHSGHEARINQCEENDKELFKRTRDLERIVWKAAGATGVIMGLVVVAIERVLR